MVSQKLSGKVALVTGASRGIGRSIALRLAEEGAAIAVNYASNVEKAQEVVEKITQNGGKAIAIQADVSQVSSDRETAEQIRENPYLQYFIGLTKYSNEAPFEASMLVHFRQRIDIGLVNRMNQSMVKNSREEESEEVNEKKLLAVEEKKK